MHLRPRRVPNSTLPATSANRVSSPPRPTPTPGWKWVPRCRMMISPADTCWPPNRLTPSRWAAESRPFRLDEAPFLCAISGLRRARGLGRAPGRGLGPRAALGDAGDPHLGVTLTVPRAAPVAGLVLVVDHADLGALGVPDDLRGDLVTTKFRRVPHHVVAVDDEQGGQGQGRADLTGQAVHSQDVVHRRLLLPAAAAHDRVHRNSLSVMCGTRRDLHDSGWASLAFPGADSARVIPVRRHHSSRACRTHRLPELPGPRCATGGRRATGTAADLGRPVPANRNCRLRNTSSLG